MSLITGAGRSGLDPVGKWSLILAPILFIVGGFMTADFGSYHTGLVGDIAANGDTAKLGLTIGIIGVALYARAILGLTRITPEAGNAQARMRVASAGVIALLAIQAVQTGMAMGIAGGDTSGAASFLGIQSAGTIVALLTVIPLAGGLAAGGLVSKYFGWVLLAVAVVGLIVTIGIGLDTETGGLVNSILQAIWGIVILVIGIIMINGDGD
ncbi:MAG TPA: hypothetical protein EYM41_07750 [Dehalococcoidia bacterium]|jgi:hypothetical protein|nr:hypothetical protein [Chloroflexota bacterium]HIM60455.1 hypothetical protein [Dehalococcoidia bacterium]|tara:strand:+ start:35 stop:667 length:633 start_codon:yes stop_codon:yes gene_type:complete